jgi:hypothetical protein
MMADNKDETRNQGSEGEKERQQPRGAAVTRTRFGGHSTFEQCGRIV